MKLYVGVTDNEWYRFLGEFQEHNTNFFESKGGKRK
jgi:hypothetical protein